MSFKETYRPWGGLDWTLTIGNPVNWQFLGCVNAEARSIEALIHLHRMKKLHGDVTMLSVTDICPEDENMEASLIEKKLKECSNLGIDVKLSPVRLDASLVNEEWKRRIDFKNDANLCLDVSSMPKRFFFNIIKSALQSTNVKNFLITYTKPLDYPNCPLSCNAEAWKSIDGFLCEDPDDEREANSRIIIASGFAVNGLREHLAGKNGEIKQAEIIIPFPAEPWKSIRRSWESAREIEDSFSDGDYSGEFTVQPSYSRVASLDASTAFNSMLNMTENGKRPTALAPLGPKPISVAMCLLAAQSNHFPLYYAQPKTYAIEYSIGCGDVYAYWVKHDGVNLYEYGDPASKPSP